MDRVFDGVLQKTIPGGFCAIIIGTRLLDGHHHPVPFDITARLVRRGWKFHQDIIRHKVTGGVKRAGVFIQKPFHGYFYPNIMTEYILVFRKPGVPIFKKHSNEEKEAARNPINRVFTMDEANSVWHVAPVPPGYLDHPCPFPEEIPFRLIRFYSYRGDLILDPFAGAVRRSKSMWTTRNGCRHWRPSFRFRGLVTGTSYLMDSAQSLIPTSTLRKYL